MSECGPTSISSDCSFCQMSQNNCCDSQGHWENSSAVGMSAQMSPAVTLGASGPFWKNSLLHSNSHSPHLLIISNLCPVFPPLSLNICIYEEALVCVSVTLSTDIVMMWEK